MRPRVCRRGFGKNGDLEVVASVSGTIILSSSDNMASLDADEMEWTNKDVPDFDDNDDLVGMDAGEATNLGLRQDGSTSKRRHPRRSYDLTRRFQTVWSALWTWSKGVLANDGLLH